jgi:hypothetical protein
MYIAERQTPKAYAVLRPGVQLDVARTRMFLGKYLVHWRVQPILMRMDLGNEALGFSPTQHAPPLRCYGPVCFPSRAANCCRPGAFRVPCGVLALLNKQRSITFPFFRMAG